MTNRIRHIEVRDRLVNPAEAEVWIRVESERLTPTTEIHGRLMGPRCLYTTTVEVAYPLRSFARPPEGLASFRRVVIPEASWWDPESPFFYEGPVELWEEGRLCDQQTIRHGLRSVNLGPGGLRLNGKALRIHGVTRSQCTAAEARELRAAGINTLFAPVAPATASLWDEADRLGFLVLGRLPPDEESLQQARALAAHPCCLGWVLDEDERTADSNGAATRLRTRPGPLVGRFVRHLLDLALLSRTTADVDFLVCEESSLPQVAQANFPFIALAAAAPSGSQPPPLFLGTILR